MKSIRHTISRRTFLRRTAAAAPFFLMPHSLHAMMPNVRPIHRTAFAMGTTVSIQAYHSDRKLVHHAVTKAFDELHRIDRVLSVYNPESAVSAINAAAGKSEIAVELFVAEVINRAVHYSIQTNGVFDCTIEPLMKLWGFRENGVTKIPSDKEIQATVEAVGYKNITVNNNSIGLLRGNSSIDLGGIAVGYTVDRMAAILQQEGIESALVNHSGDIFAIGAPPEKEGWEISIRDPLDTNEIVETITLSNKAISTSGAYEKYVEYDGKQYGHIIDAVTGIPARKHASISIVADTSLEADIYSTAWYCTEQRTIAKQKGEKRVLMIGLKNQLSWL